MAGPGNPQVARAVEVLRRRFSAWVPTIKRSTAATDVGVKAGLASVTVVVTWPGGEYRTILDADPRLARARVCDTARAVIAAVLKARGVST